MKLPPQDAAQYFELSYRVLSYVNQKLNLLPDRYAPDDIREMNTEDRASVRDALWKNVHLIDSFVDENPFTLSSEELEIVSNWKHFIRSRFFLVKYLKNYAVFMEEGGGIPYGVCALLQDFTVNVGKRLPVLVETVLLPYKGRIIYGGILASYSIYFGSGMRENIVDSYNQAKARYGIVTSLPFSVNSKGLSDEDLLRFYMKNQKNRDLYWNEIWDLIGKKPELQLIFHQEMGKVNARTYKKRLREAGIDRGWFAILHGLIVASAMTETEARKAMEQIVPSYKHKWVYIFNLGK